MDPLSSRMCAICALLCMLIVSQLVPVFAQSRTTLETDARLEKKVNAHAAGIPLKALLQDWSKRTGVALAADPSVAENRVVARLINRPLREAMRLVAAAFGYEWRVEPDKPDAPRYVLHAPPAALQSPRIAQQALTTRFYEHLHRAVRSIPQHLLALSYAEYCRAVGDLPTDEKLALPVESLPTHLAPRAPYVEMLDARRAPREDIGKALEFGLRRALLLEGARSPEAWLAVQILYRHLTPTGAVDASVGSLPATVLTPYRAARSALNELLKATPERARAGEPAPAEPSTEPQERVWEPSEIIAPRDPLPVDARLRVCYHPLQRKLVVEYDGDAERFAIPVERMVWELYTHAAVQDADAALRDALTEAESPAAASDEQATPAPWLKELARRWYAWFGYALMEAFEQANIEAVGEFYPVSEPVEPTPRPAEAYSITDPATLYEQVARLYEFRREGGCYVFTARTRTLARALDIPDSALAPYVGRQRLDLEHAAQLAARATPNQIGVLARELEAASAYCAQRNFPLEREVAIESLRRAYAQLGGWSLYALMRWYSQLSTASRQLLASGAPVMLSTLRPDERRALESLEPPCGLRAVYADILASDEARIQLRFWREVPDPLGSERVERVWKFILDTTRLPDQQAGNPFLGVFRYTLILR